MLFITLGGTIEVDHTELTLSYPNGNSVNPKTLSEQEVADGLSSGKYCLSIADAIAAADSSSVSANEYEIC